MNEDKVDYTEAAIDEMMAVFLKYREKIIDDEDFLDSFNRSILTSIAATLIFNIVNNLIREPHAQMSLAFALVVDLQSNVYKQLLIAISQKGVN